MHEQTYRFLDPAVFRIKHPDNSTELIGYGIGDTITILELKNTHLSGTCEKLETIPLANGSWIVEFPDHIRYEAVYE